MAHPNLNLVLGRVLIAAAWADGRLDEQEHAALEDLLFRLPDLSPQEWRTLEEELGRPVPPQAFEERRRELQGLVDDPEDRRLARRTLEQLGTRLPRRSREAEALQGIVEALESPPAKEDAGLFGRLRGLIAPPLRERAERLREHFERGERLESSLEGRVRDEWPAGEGQPDAAELHRLCVGAAILAHVVHLDDEIDEGEVAAMRAALQQRWGLGRGAASLVADLALDESARGLDLYTLLRDFFERTEEEERKRFLAAVFQVAAGDGRASYEEIEEIRRIGRGLLLSHRHFIAAKLSLDESERET